jgi:DNA-binding NarL/FixJ family response regulator
MHRVSESTARVAWKKAEALSPRLLPSQIILFVTTAGSISNSLICSVEREFPGAVVHQVENVAAACTAFDYPVRLILIDTAFTGEIETRSSDLRRHHPDAAIALSHDRGACSGEEMLALKAVRGVLPLNLRLDIWLSAVRIVLHGGDYYPSSIFQFHLGKAAGIFSQPLPAAPLDEFSQDPEQMPRLTDRETQVLELVSRGLQNKAIAFALNLSDHTVKIHLHNVTRKLGAHNRTEAAAAFLKHQARQQASQRYRGHGDALAPFSHSVA